jgi:hypothetical protein
MSARQHGRREHGCTQQRGGEPLYGQTLDSSIEALDAWWAINWQRDGMELLKEFMEAMPRARVHVVRNCRATRRTA